MDGVRLLGRYEPSQYTSETLETEIRQFLPACCQRERISVRIPQGIPPHPDNLQWHQDGGGPAGTTRHMVVWASDMPTELYRSDTKPPDDVIGLPIFPKMVVWFDNDRCWHRQPKGTDESRRWFISIRCSGAL